MVKIGKVWKIVGVSYLLVFILVYFYSSIFGSVILNVSVQDENLDQKQVGQMDIFFLMIILLSFIIFIVVLIVLSKIRKAYSQERKEKFGHYRPFKKIIK